MPDKQRQSQPDVRALVSRLNQQSQQLLEREIIAPLLPGGKIRTRLSRMVYEFKLRGQFTGWGRFRPLNEREAQLLAEAQPWERGAYLEQFPLLRVILLWPDLAARQAGVWWALPYNASDAKQRFGFSMEPLHVFLCDQTNGAECFERVIARVDGRLLWFEGPDALADPLHAEWLRDTAVDVEHLETFLPGLAGSERAALICWHFHQLEQTMPPGAVTLGAPEDQPAVYGKNRQQQRELLRREARRSPLERSLQRALAKADARLLSFSEAPAMHGLPGSLIVEWSEQGQQFRYRSIIDSQMSVVSSGICLSGRDNDFDLTSLVSVIADSPWHGEE